MWLAMTLLRKGLTAQNRKEGKKGRCQGPFPNWEFYSPRVTSCVGDISHRYFDNSRVISPIRMSLG